MPPKGCLSETWLFFANSDVKVSEEFALKSQNRKTGQ